VLAEEVDCVPTESCAQRIEGFGSVLCAGGAAQDLDALRAQHLVSESSGPASSGAEFLRTRGSDGSTRLDPLEDERVSKTMERIDVDVSGRAGDFLLLAEVLTIHPGWRASIDGAPARMYRADGLATLVRLPTGARRVSFSYRAPGFVLGAWISAATSMALVAWAWSARRRVKARGA
jgi:hypothetical protein